MAMKRDDSDAEGQNSAWLGFAKIVWIVVFTVLVYFLVRSMVHHHFFSGGQLNLHDTTKR